MTALRRRMLADLQLRGLAPRTQPCDVEAVKQLTPHYRRAPDQISEDELRQYFLVLSNGKKVAERSLPGSPLWDPVLLRAHAAATVARLRPRAPPAPPNTACGVESAGGAVPPGRGRAPESPDGSAADLRLWAAPARGHTAAGRRQRGATEARAGAPGPRGQGPPRATRAAGAGVIAGVRAAPAAPPLGVPRPRRLGAPAPPFPPTDLQSGRAPAWAPQRGLHPSPAARLCHPSVGARGVAAGHAGTAGPQQRKDYRPLPASDAPDFGRRARHDHCPPGRSLNALEHAQARGGRRLPALRG
jgi:hypothetical protein